MSESDLITYELDGDVALIGINRPAKRNAVHEEMFETIGELAERAGREARVAIIHGIGDHFSAGLDLQVTAERLVSGIDNRKMSAHKAHVSLDALSRGTIPIIAALTGAVVGAGLEIAASAQIRVADQTAFFALPEGQRGIFVGAGGSVRIQRLIGYARMAEMMLTGRVLDASEAERLNLVQYIVDAGSALTKARELAGVISKNTPETNWTIVNGLARVNDMSYSDAIFTETLLANNVVSEESERRLRAFVEGRAAKVVNPTRNGAAS